jgi:hypothetical protein
MGKTKHKTIATILVTTAAVTVGGLFAQQPLAPQSASPVALAGAKSKPDSAEMAETEAKLAKLRDLIKPQPGEFATNIARIAWERDPWEAAVKAAKEGKPVISYGLQNAGVTCGFG